MISFTKPLPRHVISYEADFEGLQKINLTRRNDFTLVGFNPSKFTMCTISLSSILTTALRVQRQFFSWHFVRKAKKPIKSKRRFYLGKL